MQQASNSYNARHPGAVNDRLTSGSDTTTSASGAAGALPVTWASHTSCLAMTLALRLGETHIPRDS